MLKLILLGFLLVHVTLQTEIVPEQEQDSSPHHIEAKKHVKNKEWKEHKKYKGEENWKKPHYDSKESFLKYEKKEHDEKEGLHLKDKKHYYEKEKKYHKQRDHVRREIIEAHPNHESGESQKELVNHESGESHIEFVNHESGESLASDINVNKENLPKDPDSEYLQVKKAPTLLDMLSPPNPNNTALMARYIIHNVDWAAMATVTSRGGAKQNPFANIISMSDGPVRKGSGVPYFYITPLDLSIQDVNKVNKASMTATLAQTDFCQKQTLDAQDPRCARLILSGKMKRVKAGSSEEQFATKALFSRHPAMKDWPKDHDFYIAKLKIGQVIVLDHFGGPTYIDVEQYLHPESA